MSKRALRRLIKEKLSRLSAESTVSQSNKTADALRALPEYIAAKRIAYYMSMDSGEVLTRGMIELAFADDKRVFLPQIVPVDEIKRQFAGQSTELRMLEVRSLAEVDALEPQGKYQLREPQDGIDVFSAGGLSLVVVPGVAFTRSCLRIGHGKGYYDAFLAKHEAWSKTKGALVPVTVGVGLDAQLVDDIPREPHDRALDVVIVNGIVHRPGN